MKRWYTLWAPMSACVLVLVACGGPLLPIGPSEGGVTVGAQAGAKRGASLLVRPTVARPGFRVQSTVAAYTEADITKITVALIKLPGTVESPPVASVDLLPGQFNFDVNFSGLESYTSYLVTATAFKGAEVISELCSEPIDVLDDSALAPLSLIINLKNQTFSGTANAGLMIVPGTLDPAGTTSISIAPAPTPAPTAVPSNPTVAILDGGSLIASASVTGAPTQFGQFVASITGNESEGFILHVGPSASSPLVVGMASELGGQTFGVDGITYELTMEPQLSSTASVEVAPGQ